MKNPLGERSEYSDRYDPSQLFAIERAAARTALGIESSSLPFDGHDLWNCYEISWLAPDGKPVAAIGELLVPAASPRLVESKSLKLYLNSFNNSTFESPASVVTSVESDLSKLLGAAVKFSLSISSDWNDAKLSGKFAGNSIDAFSLPSLSADSNLTLRSKSSTGHFSLYSHLLRTLCPVTGQPDWGSVLIEYVGREIEGDSLLAYIVSLRNHQGFHEECCEKIFLKIISDCRPEKLALACHFTRRGGIDINPLRTTPGFRHSLGFRRGVRQ
jgi:7-cyano-7-deazaguanine reductase